MVHLSLVDVNLFKCFIMGFIV